MPQGIGLKNLLVTYPIVFILGIWLGSFGFLKSSSGDGVNSELSKAFQEAVIKADSNLDKRAAKTNYLELKAKFEKEVEDQCFIVEYTGRACNPITFKMYLKRHGYDV